MAERKIQIIKLSVRKALPVIAFFLSSFFIVYFLFGVHYLLVVPPLAAFFSSWKRKDEKGVRRYIILLIHETILLFLASLGTANIVMMVFLNIAVPFILVFTQSTQFDKRGYYAYMLFFVYISFVPPVNAEDFLRMLAAIWVVTLYMGIVLFLLTVIHRQGPEEKILMKYVLQELSELTLLLAMPERKEELRLRFSELLYRKTAERQSFSAISTQETKLDDMLSTLLQRYSFMVMDEDWYSELDSQRIAELRRLASFLSETAKSIGTSWQDMQIEAAHEILETMNIPEGRIRIFIRSILHMVDFMLNTASDTELQKRKRINWRNLRHEIAIRLTSEGFELRFASRLAAVMAISGLINYLIPTVNSYWIPLNAFMLLQTSTSESSYYMKTNPIGIIAGCLIEYIVYPFLPGLWGELLFALLMISMMYASKPGSWLYPAFHTCYTLTIALMTLDETSAIGLRLLYLLIAVIIVFLVNRFFFPILPSSQFRYSIKSLFRLHNDYWNIIRMGLVSETDLSLSVDILSDFHMYYEDASRYLDEHKDAVDAERLQEALLILWKMFSELEQIHYLVRVKSIQSDETDSVLSLISAIQKDLYPIIRDDDFPELFSKLKLQRQDIAYVIGKYLENAEKLLRYGNIIEIIR